MRRFLLILFAFCCVSFALYNHFNKVVKPSSPYILKCEGIILDSTLRYHITSKPNIEALKRIRAQEIRISNNDILLHYSDANMSLVTPSYWGSLYYEGEWKFRLDKSFTTNPNKDKALPFLRYVRKQDGQITFIPPSSILSEADLKKRLFFNYHSGKAQSRYYLEIKEFNSGKTLPFFDDGIKRSYPLGRTNDTILLAFNTPIQNPRHFNFSFDNTSKGQGLFNLIYHPEDDEFEIFDTTSKASKEIKSRESFQVEDIVFSISNRYSFFDVFLLSCFLIITILSFAFILYQQFKVQPEFQLQLYSFMSVLCGFFLLGFPVLALAFDYQNFGVYRRIILSIMVPSVPILAIITSSIGNVKGIRLKIINIFQIIITLIGKLINAYPWLAFVLFTIFIIPLKFTSNERVLGILPTLHYAKILILLAYFILYTNWFGRLISKFLSKAPKKFYKVIPFLPALILILIAILIFLFTHDVGILMFTVISVLIMEVVLFKKSRFYGFKLWWIVLIFPLIVLLIFHTSKIFDYGRKSHRVTYTLANPESSYYKNTREADRETFAFQYHALQNTIENPFGVQNMIIPSHKKAVSHTDYSILWSTIDNGVIFLSLLFFGMAFLFYSVFFMLRRLTLKQSKDDPPSFFRGFLAFVLLMFLLQTVVPIASNLMLPFSFLTGVPFPFISISIGDALMIYLLIVLLHISASEICIQNDYLNQKVSFSFAKKWSLISIFGLLIWGISRVLLFDAQNSKISFWIKKTENNYISNYKFRTFKDNKEVLKELDYVFLNADMESLSAQQKQAGSFFNCIYYKNDPKKLLGESTKFYLDQNKVKYQTSLDSLFSQERKIISGNNWNDDTVYEMTFFLNGKKRSYVSSKYFKNLDLNNPYLNIDLSALINQKLEEFININLRNYKNLKTSVLLADNENGNIIINASYPFNTKHPDTDLSFYPGSIKKVLLAKYFSDDNQKEMDKKIFPMNKLKTLKGTGLDWIGQSNNYATSYVWDSIIDRTKFITFLEKEFNMPFNSTSYLNGYANLDWDRDKRSIYRTYIGGEVKYTPQQINSWFQKLAKESFEDDYLKMLLEQPLLHQHGTARSVKRELRDNDINPKNFIAKTGTLSYSGSNIATGFAISNKKYTVTVLIDGNQPNNSQGKHSKNLFNILIPFLHKYLIEE